MVGFKSGFGFEPGGFGFGFGFKKNGGGFGFGFGFKTKGGFGFGFGFEVPGFAHHCSAATLKENLLPQREYQF